MKILVVDDDTIVLYSCKRVLESEGFEVYSVPSAKKAIERLSADNFSVLLIDVKMPEHDGMWLIEAVRNKGVEIPILVMSGYSTPETIENVTNLGAINFIPKPFTPDELLKTVQEILLQKGVCQL